MRHSKPCTIRASGSVYLMTQRIQRHPFLALFDGADPNVSTSERSSTTTPTQALFMMNDPLVHEQSALLAGRMLSERGDDAARLQLLYQLAFTRARRASKSGRMTASFSRATPPGCKPRACRPMRSSRRPGRPCAG